MQPVPLYLCSLLAATSQFSIFIGQKMQLTGWENANNMRNTTCTDFNWVVLLFIPILWTVITFDPIIPLRSKSIGDLFFVGHLYYSRVKEFKCCRTWNSRGWGRVINDSCHVMSCINFRGNAIVMGKVLSEFANHPKCVCFYKAWFLRILFATH